MNFIGLGGLLKDMTLNNTLGTTTNSAQQQNNLQRLSQQLGAAQHQHGQTYSSGVTTTTITLPQGITMQIFENTVDLIRNIMYHRDLNKDDAWVVLRFQCEGVSLDDAVKQMQEKKYKDKLNDVL